jgi:light-regulated signal transduction histidine kinase (bacteriophytochrome)
LQYTTIDKKEPEIANLDINSLLTEIQYLLNASILEADAEIRVMSVLPIIRANATHIKQLFQQLIHNGLKFRASNRKCLIEVSYSKQDNKHLFAIKDNGIGIAPAYHQKVFKLFNRLDKHNYDGTGIGLAICKKIVHLYNGNIWIKSDIDAGCTFFFTIEDKPH